MRELIIVCSFLYTVTLCGCSSVPVNKFDNFAATISGDGYILAPNTTSNDSGFVELPSNKSSEYIDNIFKSAEESGNNDKLLIFVHGGLNNLPQSTKRVNSWINKYLKDSTAFENHYPILLNWDSGFFESYGEHLFSVRQGQKTWWAVPTSPLYFTADTGRSAVRAPIDILYTSYRDVEAIPLIENGTNKYRVNSQLIYEVLKKQYPSNISLGNKLGWGLHTLYKVPWNILTWPTQLVTSPIVDGFGTPAWEGMLRRSKVLFNNVDEFDIDKNSNNIPSALEGQPKSIVSVFAERLKDYCIKHNNAEITLIGHSMGTIIINAMLSRYPELNIKHIVYMAGADSIRNTINSIAPYMKIHNKAKFYNLTLHPQNEVEESNVFGLAPRGSLLVWIDDFFSTPHTQFDRTVGRWENIIQAYGEFPEEIRTRIFIKAFDQDDNDITKHGSFGNVAFWEEKFWMPSK